MYERFYRLRERPFALTPDPDYLYPSRVHKEALSYLRYGIESHAGFVVITGAIGSGKTTLLQTMLRGLDSQTTVARVMNTLLDPRELLESAMIDLGLDPDGKSKPALLKAFGEFLVNERAAGRLVLLVIDEAQNLSLPALEEIRMLSNLETEKSKLLQIILIGQPDLRDKLERPELEQLRQRITVSYHLEPLDADETHQYINHRLARASVGAPLEFPHDVTARIHERSNGVPRLINVIADATLVFGYGEERSEIDQPLIDEVIEDLDATGVLGPRSNANRRESIVPPVPAMGFDQATIRLKPDATADGIRVNDTATQQAESGATVGFGAAIGPGDTVGSGATVGSGFTRTYTGPTAEEQKLRKELAELAKELKRREQEMAIRERELAEQRRVLADQYRLLKAQPQAAPAAAPGAAAWPPASTSARAQSARPAVRGHAPAFATYHTKRRTSLWRRVKNTLLGIPQPALEDTL